MGRLLDECLFYCVTVLDVLFGNLCNCASSPSSRDMGESRLIPIPFNFNHLMNYHHPVSSTMNYPQIEELLPVEKHMGV